jgi:crotonobetainyl-CoA:carnitine CoA-transferase CaiB-like acyl-CoA transferase
MKDDDGFLTDVTVLDLGQAIAAPSAAGLLADFGADVVSVEPPGGSSQREFAKGSPLANFDRNKRSIVLDLKTDRGTEALYRLVEVTDVVIHNNRPGKMGELGCDYNTLSKVNSELIYCSLTGYGESGPYKDRPGFDPLAQAVSGLMSMTGESDRKPSRIGASTIDIGTGIYAAYAIMMCLYKRKETGRGQKIETSLIDTAAMFMSQWYTYVSMGEKPPQRQGHTWDAYAPAGVFETETNPIYMSVPFQHLWVRLCKAVDRPDWIENPRYETKESRLQNRDDLHSELDDEFRSYSQSDLMDILLDANVPAAEVNTVEQALRDQHLQARGTIQTIEDSEGDDVRAVAPPIRLSEEPETLSSAPPELGEDSREVLRECGYDEDEIESLLAEGVIQTSS